MDGIDTKVEEVASDADEAVKTASQVSQRVDSLSSTITQVSKDVQSTNSAVLIQNPGFETGDLTGWTADGWSNPRAEKFDKTLKGIGEYRFNGYAQQGTSNYSYLRSKAIFGAIPGRTYKVSVSALYADSNTTAYMLLRRISDNARPQITKAIGPSWTSFRGELTVPSDWSVGDNVRFEFAIQGISSGNNRILADDFSIVDVTDAKTANNTANSALSKSSSVEQSLNSFKTSVSQTYETKSDASSKQSSLQQSVNNLRTEVSEQYTTKDEFNNLQVGGTNLLRLGAYGFHSAVTGTSYDKANDLYKFTVPANATTNNSWGVGLNTHKGKSYVSGGVPWQKYGILSFYIYVDHACSINIDVNTQAWTGSAAGTGNDHDTNRSHSSLSIPANQWTQVWQRWQNAKTNSSTGNPNKVDLYDCSTIGVLSTSSAINVQIKKLKFEVGTKPTEWSPCPADMLSSDQAAQTYSTKSYVDQTARTVSLGVVEEYKNGKHGSALATQSDITAAKDSITSTVSQTYTTKTEFNNLQVGGTNIARDTQAFGHNGVSSTEEGYLKAYVNRTNGTYKGLTVRNIISSDGTYVAVCEYLVTNVKHSEYYTLSFWAKGSGKIRTYFHGPSGYIGAKAVSASNGSGDTIFADGQWNMTLSSSWQRYFVVYQTAASGGTSTDKYMLLRNDNDMASCDVCGVMIERGNKASDWSASPLDVSATYATKTEFKQTSDSLTVTISSAVSKAESAATAASNAQNTANAAAGSATNYIKNGGPNGTSNPIAGWTVSGNVYKHTFPGGQNHVDIGYTTLAHPIVVGRTYRLSLDARVTSGTFSSSDYFNFGLNIGWQAIRAQALTSSWKTYSGVVTSTKETTQVFMSSYVGSSGSKVVEMRNVSMTDVTETYTAATNAQSTANTANSNAQNAQNRVGNLETCIKMTSDGVRVGKISNGNFTGYSALVNSSGSFDILDNSGNTKARFTKEGEFIKAKEGGIFFLGSMQNAAGGGTDALHMGIVEKMGSTTLGDNRFYAGLSVLPYYNPDGLSMTILNAKGGIVINSRNDISLTTLDGSVIIPNGKIAWDTGGLGGQIRKLLWTGNITWNGSATITGLDNYNLFIFEIDGKYPALTIRDRGGTRLHGSGGSESGSVFIHTISASISANTISSVQAHSTPLNNSGNQIQKNVTAIYGLI